MSNTLSEAAELASLRDEIAELAGRQEAIEPLRAARQLLREAEERAVSTGLPPGIERLSEAEFRARIESGLKDSEEGRTVSLEEAVEYAFSKLGRK